MNTLECPWIETVSLSADSQDDSKVIVSDSHGPVARVSKTIADVLECARTTAPELDLDALAGICNQDVDEIRTTLTYLSDLVRPPESGHKKRIYREGSFSVQFTLLNPSALFAKLPFIPRLVTWPPFYWGTWVCAGVGLMLALAAIADPTSPVHGSLTVVGYLAVLAGFFLSTFVHEFSHGATLVGFGGTSSRLGLMLFYFTPAFFCDVTDAWRITPRQRVKVALAGIQAQALIGSLSIIIGETAATSWATEFMMFGVVQYAYAVLDAIPLVKLDGYVALAGYLDRPNLRTITMGRFYDTIVDLLNGRHSQRDNDLSFGWALYAIGCLLFPFILVGVAVLTLDSVLVAVGSLGDYLSLAGFAVAAALVIRVIWNAYTKVVRHVKHLVVRIGALAVLVAAMTAFVTMVPIPLGVAGGITVVGDQTVLMVDDDVVFIEPGDIVTYTTPGVIPGRPLGTTTVTGQGTACSIPITDVAPLKGISAEVPGLCYPLDTLPIGNSYPVSARIKAEKSTILGRIQFLIDRLT